MHLFSIHEGKNRLQARGGSEARRSSEVLSSRLQRSSLFQEPRSFIFCDLQNFSAAPIAKRVRGLWGVDQRSSPRKLPRNSPSTAGLFWCMQDLRTSPGDCNEASACHLVRGWPRVSMKGTAGIPVSGVTGNYPSPLMRNA